MHKWPKRSLTLPATALVLILNASVLRGAERKPQSAELPAAEFTNHLQRLRAKLPAGFTALAQPPFIVVGDEPAATVQRRATNTVKWAVDRLKKGFFQHDPAESIEIWLFKDRASYDRHTREIFGDTPTTPFGYYSPAHQALIMNIATGGGTLVHEIVHPFMRANFPACPAWFNEGLGSLYEQCGDQDGHIHGYTNWRLAGLQAAIKGRRTVPLAVLLGLSDEKFYADEKGAHYAQARYLCYYLQESGLLVPFFKQFIADARQDPTGLQTLKQVLGENDLGEFQKRWEKFVLELTFVDTPQGG